MVVEQRRQSHSIRRCERSTTCACSRFRRRGIPCTTPWRSASMRRTRACRRRSRNAPGRRRSGIRRAPSGRRSMAMPWVRRLLREPLVHFLVAGAVLFAAYALVRGPGAAPADERTIVVDRRTLLTFMQYRSNAFEPSTFEASLDAMSDDERRRLIEAYVDEEILYREAKALGLSESDYVIRQRLIQKLGFLLGDIADASLAIGAAELQAYFDTHREAYAIEPAVTFTHVFFDADRRGAEGALAAARAA